ncbi:MAG: 16S rRNA (cytosine(1402)-N(4))-methyltransferase RsmH [Acidimicrobiia bacterium]
MYTGEFSHTPVMVAEVVAAFAGVPAGILVDGTVGGGGHAAALLSARDDCSLVGLDRDGEAVAAAGVALAGFGTRARVEHGGFEDLGRVLGPERVSGVFLDLGVSSHQLDEPARGFSYRSDAPLDMRMDRSQTLSAADVVDHYDEDALRAVISRWGEERFAAAIARRIVAHRPVATTGRLAEVVRDAIPAPARRRGPHPARRTFQAIRIEVNGELDHLDAGLDAAFGALAPGGRLAVLAYHSLEDRMVKRRFARWSARFVPPPGMPAPPPGAPEPSAVLVTRRAKRPSSAEVAVNPRSESALLRVVERSRP